MRNRKKYAAIMLATIVTMQGIPINSWAASQQVSEMAQNSIQEIEENSGAKVNSELEETPVTESTVESEDTAVIEEQPSDIPSQIDETTENDPGQNLSIIEEDYAPAEELISTYGSEERVGYPESYDLRQYMTSVKDQGSTDTCWAYSTLAAAEGSLLMKDSSLTSVLNFNEDLLAYNTMCPYLEDPLGNTTGDTNYPTSGDWRNYMNIGGNPLIASMVLSQWKGANDQTTGILTSNAYKNSAILTGFAYIGKSNIKLAMSTYGPLAITYYSDLSYYSDTNGYYYGGDVINKVNHAVTLVGWDDNYDKSNFNSPKVKSNGAWIAKNSWGSSWGDNGYFYLSYEDPLIKYYEDTEDRNKWTAGTIVAPVMASTDTYDHNYQYDGTANMREDVAVKALDEGDSVSNVYQVTGNPSGGELLKAVGFFFRNTYSSIRYEIYTNLTDVTDPTSGRLAYTSDVESTTFQGYYTFDLKQPVFLKEGSNYSIVITAQNAFKYYADTSFNGALVNSWIGYYNKMDVNQSFTRLSDTTTWTDNYNSQYCARIKGFTKDVAFTNPVADITLNKTTASIARGKTLSLTASVTPSDATVTDVIWSSSDTDVATVSPDGVVTMNASATAGSTAVITASAQDNSGVTATCTVKALGYNIAYKLNGGENSTANPSTYYNEKVTLKNPTRKGYTFAGWYTSSTYKTKITYIAKGTAKNYTLYAKWTKVSVAQASKPTACSPATKTMKLTYKKVSGAKAYQIVYSTSSSFATKNYTLSTTTSKTIKNLKKGKTYYVRIRAYKMDSTGAKVYGKFSGTAKVKIR